MQNIAILTILCLIKFTLLAQTNPDTSDLSTFFSAKKEQKEKLFLEAKNLAPIVARESKEKTHRYQQPNLYQPFINQLFRYSNGVVTHLQDYIHSLYQDSSLTIEKYVSPNPIQKLSGNPLYVIKKDGQIKAYIKGFLFLDEYVRVIISDLFLTDLFKDFYYLQAPKTEDYFIYSDESGSFWPMLVMQKSPGVTLDTFIPHWDAFLAGLKKSVRAINELHQKAIAFLPPNQVKNFNLAKQLDSQLEFILKKWPYPQLKKEKFIEVVSALKQKFLQFPGPFTYHHGDFLLGNVLIDCDQVTLIDNHSLVYSLSSDYSPIGRPEVDYAKMYNKLVLMADIYDLDDLTRKKILTEYDHFFADKEIYQMPLNKDLVNFFLMAFAIDDVFRVLKDQGNKPLKASEERKLKGQLQFIIEPIVVGRPWSRTKGPVG